ncbi:LuxR family transcriptional regulator [Nocardioides sp. W7]|uniref:helix-turn-helix transcriptional regulator n=1 Tax=Nocardioides sp. W7 TaxID=2931390 RepID=UPI001FD01A6F|nr:LuxR family transcriptional regulator [Nocardioides sp. W7]
MAQEPDPGRDSPLLRARCAVPAAPRCYVERPRLDEALEAGTGRGLTLVSAPAGSGKTVAVAAWATGRLARQVPGERIGWVTFEAGDDRPAIFWPLVVDCLRRCGLRVPGGPPGSGRTSRTLLARIGTALAELDGPLTLVLDGYEVADRQLAEGLEFLLAHSGEHLRLVIVSRTDPILPVHRWRLSGDLAEVRLADLAWNQQETERLLQQAGVVLRPETIRALVDRVGGWTAGLRFVATTLAQSQDPDAEADRITGATGNIAEYLINEILMAQPVDARDVLLRTSVVELLQPGLIEELGGRAASRTLAVLAHANVLVEEVATKPGWYRYHALFRELLCAELAYASPARLAGLQRRAVRWYAAHGVVAELPVGAGPTAAVRTRAACRGAAQEAGRPARAPELVGPGLTGVVLEPLTTREREVLGHLSELLTTEEIAATMFVSVNTVRTHVRHILRKLAVTRRNEAVRRARALELLGA